MAKSAASTEVKNGKARRTGALKSRAQRTTRRTVAKPGSAAAPVRSPPRPSDVAAVPPPRDTTTPAEAPPPAATPSRTATPSPTATVVSQRAASPVAAIQAGGAEDSSAAGLVLADALTSGPSSGLVEGTLRIQSAMLAFGWRETERGVAAGRAMLASRSLPEIISLQAAWLSETFENALRQGIALGRLTADLMRTASGALRR